MRTFLCIISILLLTCTCLAENYGGIEFPNGALSFVDAVIKYDPYYSEGPAPADTSNPNDALGIPDVIQDGCGDPGFITLGRGGLIELAFTNNYLVNSGDIAADLHIFEVGSDVEDTFVAIHPTPETEALLGPSYDANDDGYYEVGKVYGAVSSIDIDSFFPGHNTNTLLFDAVQLIDDPAEGQASGECVGADIDAVGAIGSVRSCDYSIIGDLNLDCKVDLRDFALMAMNWLLDCKQTPQNSGCIPLP